MNVVVVIQARTGSTRLPGKVLLPAAGAPLLQRMLERVTSARTPSDVVVATTMDPADDAVIDIAHRSGVRAVRGHATDLLDRHVRAVHGTAADYVVKIPSDCPLIDPETIDCVIGKALASNVDFVSNLHPPTWPDGFDVEVMTRAALETAWHDAKRPHEREHTTPFIWERRDRFRSTTSRGNRGSITRQPIGGRSTTSRTTSSSPPSTRRFGPRRGRSSRCRMCCRCSRRARTSPR
jgi:spore coat polysaccharide biosynthesis protein SpsF